MATGKYRNVKRRVKWRSIIIIFNKSSAIDPRFFYYYIGHYMHMIQELQPKTITILDYMGQWGLEKTIGILHAY